MNVLEFLMQGDPVIKRLTKKYLLDETVTYDTQGFIEQYLKRFDDEKGLFGGSIYNKKWISTHYTLKLLKYMEIDPFHPVYQQALNRVLKLWNLDKQKMKKT